VARDERRGDLRHAALGGLRRGADAVVEGSFNDTKRATFTGEDVRFTAKGATLYAIALAWPETGGSSSDPSRAVRSTRLPP